jgi:hypothetical protein
LPILENRYVDILLGEPGSLFMTLFQAPLIGGLIALRWHDCDPGPTLNFVICLAAVWFGCVNSCREIVKESGIYQRERLAFLSIRAYVLSKFKILVALSSLQCAMLLLCVHYWVGIPGNKAGLMAVLIITGAAGTALGLLISSLSSTSDKAVATLPVLIIPQILFSGLTLTSGTGAWARIVRKLMIMNWSQEAFDNIQKISSANLGTLISDFTALTLMCTLFVAATMAALKASDPEGKDFQP